jgi:phosphoglycerate dehydrogenase-like enzyme
MSNSPEAANDIILFDPYPRPIDLIFAPHDKARLEQMGRVLWHDGDRRAADDFIDEHLPHTMALVGQSDMPKERLDRAPHLRAIFNVESNFMPNVDYDECFRRGIPVLSTAPVFAGAVAEMALGLALSAARSIPRGDAQMRARTEILYDEGANQDTFLLSGKTLGLIGCGNLGRALLPLLQPFSRDILVHDPWIQPSILREMGVEPCGLLEVFQRSRVVFILAATTTENQNGLDRKYFEAMARGSIVVLVSRAGVVNWDDLLDTAASGHIRAAIDVFPDEPIAQDARVRDTPNTILSAHRAGNVPEVWTQMGEMVADDLEWILRGLPPQRMQRATQGIVSRLRSKPVG